MHIKFTLLQPQVVKSATALVLFVFIVLTVSNAKPVNISKSNVIITSLWSGATESEPSYILIPSVSPKRKNVRWWQNRHAKKSLQAQTGQPDLIMIGDSLVHNFETRGRQLYYLYFGRYDPLNLGFNADLTEHALWRLRNGEIDGISPKLAIIMIGTNNSRRKADPPDHTYEGIREIINELRARLPNTRILLLGIFPRGPKKGHPLRQKNEAVNLLLPKLADGESIFYMDIGDKFTDEAGNLTRKIMYDFLHPTVAGYQIWAESISPVVVELMKIDGNIPPTDM